MSKRSDCIQSVIDAYDLVPHPEGGYYREIYRSETDVFSPVHHKTRSAVTQIYFLLGENDISRFHRVVHDEIWHFYQGDPLNLICFDGKEIRTVQIGPGCDDFTFVVNAGVWQAAESTGSYSLVGCTVAPGFDFEDFSFLSDSPDDLNDFIQAQTNFGKFL
jgi:predicted cupin superfamily sugar epimerase